MFEKVDDRPLLESRACLSPGEGACEVCRLLAVHGRAAIRAVDLRTGALHERLYGILELWGEVCVCCRSSTIQIAAGQTPSSLIRHVEYQCLTAVANRRDGVVALEADQTLSLKLLIKPGSYPWNLANELSPAGTAATPIQQSV